MVAKWTGSCETGANLSLKDWEEKRWDGASLEDGLEEEISEGSREEKG